MKWSLVIFAVWWLLACEAGHSPSSVPVAEADAVHLPQGADTARGAELLRVQCQPCHKENVDCGFSIRRSILHLPSPSGRWLFHFLRSEDSLVAAGDPYVQELRNKWNTKDWDHSMIGLSEQEALDVVLMLSVQSR